MDDKEIIKEYALKNYKRTFTKKIILRDKGGKITQRNFIDLEPIISIKKNHIEVKNNIDASPIILSKDILK